MVNGLWSYPDEDSAEPRFYFIRSKGSGGLTHELGRRIESGNSTACLYLFEDHDSAFKQLAFLGLNPVHWELASSKDFGGVASLVKKASKLPAPTPVQVAIIGPMEVAPFGGATIDYAINVFESPKWAKQWNSGRPERPFWLLRDNAEQNALNMLSNVFTIPVSGLKTVCLFKSEMDAEEFRHSGWVSTDEWKSDGPVGSLKAIGFLKEFPSQWMRHAVINPPLRGPGSIGSPTLTPIKVIIDNVEEKGHIRDLG